MVALSSRGHVRSSFDFEDPNFERRPYDKMVAYGQSKTGSFKTVPQGAATTVWCATSPQLAGLGGVYCENCDIAPIRTEGDDGVRPYAVDPAIAQRLWTWSERWI